MIYLDHAATTPTDRRVVEAMLPVLTESYGNPSSVYSLGSAARDLVDRARETLANILGGSRNEVIFTSGASEATNLAIKGSALAARAAGRGDHVITTATEHHATLHTVAALNTLGFATTVLPVDPFGRISAEALMGAIRPDTVLVSVIYANNEIGTINPVSPLAAVCRARGLVFHVDAVQAVGALPMNVDELGADLISISGHKFYGPKGIGMLYARHGVALDPLIHGGAQEHGRRAGTENVPGIVGLAAAMQLAHDELEANVLHCRTLRDRLIEGVLSSIPDASLNGHPSDRLPNNAHFTFHHTERDRTTESLVGALDQNGICASTGSACNTHSIEPSHVLTAIGRSAADAHGSLRFTLGRDNTDEQIARVLELLPKIIRKRRSVSGRGRQASSNAAPPPGSPAPAPGRAR